MIPVFLEVAVKRMFFKHVEEQDVIINTYHLILAVKKYKEVNGYIPREWAKFLSELKPVAEKYCQMYGAFALREVSVNDLMSLLEVFMKSLLLIISLIFVAYAYYPERIEEVKAKRIVYCEDSTPNCSDNYRAPAVIMSYQD